MLPLKPDPDAARNQAVRSLRRRSIPAKLRKVFHPDGEARVSQERKAELTAAFQIFNRLKFKVID